MRWILVLGLVGCGYDIERAENSANEFMTNFPGATVASCVETDSDGDGYCACTIFTPTERIAVECGCERGCIFCAKGCKLRPDWKIGK